MASSTQNPKPLVPNTFKPEPEIRSSREFGDPIQNTIGAYKYLVTYTIFGVSENSLGGWGGTTC